MDKKRRVANVMILLVFFLWAGFLMPADHAVADDHGEKSGKHHETKESGEGHAKSKNRAISPLEKDDDGQETTGQMAAWLLGFANLTIALSILIKWTKRFAPLKPEMESSLNRFNTLQKKFLRPLHYYLNPLILCVALLHWSMSRCRSTSLPEWGLLMMSVLVILGIALKFNLCPKTMKAKVYKWHSQPALFVALTLILVLGHSIVD